MKIRLVRKFALGLATVAAVLGVVAANAQPAGKEGYLIDGQGNIVRNNYNECWRTGSWTPAMAIAECDPELVKKKEEPVVVPKIVAPPPPPEPVIQAPSIGPEKPAVKAEFKAETLFDIDKAIIKPEGRQELDAKVVSGMKAHPEVEMLLVTGHTDNIGTEKYNQKLSERRAVAVKDYLVKQGVAAGRIHAVGKGKSEPSLEANTKEKCKGVKNKRKLISCLQPDRRVVVEPEIQVPVKR